MNVTFACPHCGATSRAEFAADTREMFAGPRFMIRVACLDMHPLDTLNRLPLLKDDLNIGLCNITKCCTEVCPEHIHITDNGIIPLKERVVDEFYDPVLRVWRALFGRRDGKQDARTALPMWIYFMREALAGRPERYLPMPDGVVTARVTVDTGPLADASAPASEFEYFLADHLPPGVEGASGAGVQNVPPPQKYEEPIF